MSFTVSLVLAEVYSHLKPQAVLPRGLGLGVVELLPL